MGRAGTTITAGLFDMFFSAERSLKTTATTWFPCDPAQYEFRNRTIFENNRKYAKVMQICNVLCVLAQHYLREQSLGTTVFSHIFTLYFLRFPVQHWFSQRFLRTAALQNYNVSNCFHVFLLSVVSSNGLWEIQWYYNIFWTSLIFPLRKTVTRVLYRMIFGYHFAHKLIS